MDDLRQATIRTRHAAAPALSYIAPRRPVATAAAHPGDFLDALYASAVELARLPEALTLFARTLDADGAYLFAADPSLATDKVTIVERCLRGDGDAVDQAFARELSAELASGAGETFLGSIDPRETNHTRGRGNLHYLVIAPRCDGEPAIGIAALRGSHPFTDAERQRARALLPDIRRALDLRRRAGRLEALDLGVQLFDRNPTAILITRHRSIERSNASALALLADGRPISLAAGKLRFEDQRAHAAFELISRPDAQAQGNQAFAFVVEGTSGCTWIAQLSSIRPTSSPNAFAVVAALTPFNSASQTREAMLNGFTDLTPTERTVFAAFVDGQDIAAIAARLNRSVETVRWHVRNLFTKLGVNSQADLARLGALLLPI